MGAVYQAVDTALEKDVAVKILLPGLSHESIIRFQQEAKTAARLDHPNIVRVLDFGQTASGDLFLIMDYVGKISLEDMIKKQKRIPEEKALPIFIQIAAGLQHAHKNGILHRDVKPSNIMFSEKKDGNVQLVDFGLAKLQSDSSQKLTTTGIHVGSPLYMSPEQVTGVDVDARSDIYSLGCLMFKALTGKPALQGRTIVDTIVMQRDDVAPLISDVNCGAEFSPEIVDLVAKALEKDPDDRFQSAEELKHALEALEDLGHVRKALAANFAHDMDERQINFSNQHSSIDAVVSVAKSAMAHSKGILLFAIVTVSAVYFMCFQFNDKFRDTKLSQIKLREVGSPELMTPETVYHSQRDGGDSQFESSGKPLPLTSAPLSASRKQKHPKAAKAWDRIPQYSKESAKGMMNEIEDTPSLKEFALDPELRAAILSGKLHRLWHDHSMKELMHSELMEGLGPSMSVLWNDPKTLSAWSDPVVQEFLRTPKAWAAWNANSQSPALSKYAANENMQIIMSDKRFLALLNNPNFLTLMSDKRFQFLLNNPVNMKMMRCMEAYRDQMKSDVADVMFPMQEDLGEERHTPGT